jgi:aerobic C4-dicarboxylate transport protein
MAKSLYKNLTVQVVVAILIGGLIGAIKPDWGMALQPLADGFLKLIKMVVAPIIFLTIVVGIASMGDLKKVGRVGLKAIIYFEVVTTLALALGLLVANVAKPGVSFRENQQAAATRPALSDAAKKKQALDKAKLAAYEKKGEEHTTVGFILGIIPDNIFAAFADKDALLQVLFFSVLFGLALASLGTAAAGLTRDLEHLTHVMFRIVAFIMIVSPLGALGAIASTVGQYGTEAILPLLKLIACTFATMLLFIFIVLAAVCRLYRFSLWRYLLFIREEIFLVLGTSSSETALPRIMKKLEQMGCNRDIVGLVIPAGYSFNLDGTSIYLSVAVLFMAQMAGVHLGIGQQLSIMAILMLTSKGAAAVTGGGFITLSATMSSTRVIPLEGLEPLFGIDRILSTARALTNLIGNGVATIVVSKMEGEFDEAKYQAAIAGTPLASPAGEFPVEVAGDAARH